MTMQNKITKTKTTKGRQKIPIKRLIDENSRQVTFSKRREGLYNKASELCILTGARIAIITFSPNVRKPFCFSHPEMDAILDAYNNNLQQQQQGRTHDDDDELEKVFREQEARIEQICWEPRQQSVAARLQLEAALMMNKDDAGSSSSGAFWWDEVCVEMVDDVEELEEFTKALTDVKNNLRKRCNQLMMMMGFSAPTTTTTGDKYYSTTDHDINYSCNNITHNAASAAAACSSAGAGGLASDHHHHHDNDGSADQFDHRLLGFGGDADYLHNWNFG